VRGSYRYPCDKIPYEVGISRHRESGPGPDHRRLVRHVEAAHAVFDYPTLAESYKVAAMDAMNEIREIDRLSVEL
jgi:hypothetical protein